MNQATSETTRLLMNLNAGDRAAADQLLPLIYDELRAIAGNYFRRERPDHTLQPTALVHEAYLRLLGSAEITWESRAHFLAIASRAMRRALVNHARMKRADKRGGGSSAIGLDFDVADPVTAVDTLALEEALENLALLDQRKADGVEMRYYGGMSVEETAHVLGVSVSTVEADWRLARAWLSEALSEQ